MRFNIQNPAFLQAGSSRTLEGIQLKYSMADRTIYSVSAIGDLVVESIKNGEVVSETYHSPENQNIMVQSDANSWILLKGKVTGVKVNQSGPPSYLVDLDISKAKELIYFEGSQLYSVEKTKLDIRKNSKLETLKVNGWNIETFLADNPRLKDLDLGGSDISSLDLSKLPALEELNISGSYVQNLDLASCPNLTYLSVSNTPIQALDTSFNTRLEEIQAKNTSELTELSLQANQSLLRLDISKSGLTSIDASPCEQLERLACAGALEILNIGNNPNLVQLSWEEVSGFSGISRIYATAVNSDVADYIAGLVEYKSNGTITLRNGDPYNSVIEQAAQQTGWTVEYVDA